MTFAAKEDLGIVEDHTNQAAPADYEGDAIKMRSRGWGRFSFDCELTSVRLRIYARASESSDFVDSTDALLGVSFLTAGGFYEITDPTMAYEIKFQWSTINATNRTKVAVLLGRP